MRSVSDLLYNYDGHGVMPMLARRFSQLHCLTSLSECLGVYGGTLQHAQQAQHVQHAQLAQHAPHAQHAVVIPAVQYVQHYAWTAPSVAPSVAASAPVPALPVVSAPPLPLASAVPANIAVSLPISLPKPVAPPAAVPLSQQASFKCFFLDE